MELRTVTETDYSLRQKTCLSPHKQEIEVKTEDFALAQKFYEPNSKYLTTLSRSSSELVVHVVHGKIQQEQFREIN